MKCKYKNLSLGYIGKQSRHASLNSQYYYLLSKELNKSDDIFDQIFLFPQRVPRADFFAELLTLETDECHNMFVRRLNEIAKHQKEANIRLNEFNSVTHARRYLNWSNLLIRYGYFDPIIENNSLNYNGSFSLEIQMIREMAKIESLLSQQKEISIKMQLEFVKIYLDDANITMREKIILLNHIIVNYYRYHAKKKHKQVFDLCKMLLDIIQQFESNSFTNTLYCSVAYRGLAMVNEFGFETQAALIKQAEILARTIQSKTPLETILAKENLAICLQSTGKWCLMQKDFGKTETCYQEMAGIDPHDSTAHSELGLYYFNQDNYNKASDYFRKAMILGPPAAGMNAYFYAKCLENMGLKNSAIIYFYESTQLDPYAVSAWIDLMAIYKEKNENKKAQDVAHYINHSSVLYEQLDDEEKSTIHNMLG